MWYSIYMKNVKKSYRLKVRECSSDVRPIFYVSVPFDDEKMTFYDLQHYLDTVVKPGRFFNELLLLDFETVIY